jgi:hypothetical protein
MDASHENLQVAPAERVMEMICGYWVTQAVHATVQLSLPDLIASGIRQIDALAEATQTHPVALSRLLRGLESLGLVAASPNGWFFLTPYGECLRSDVPNSVRNLALLAGAEHYRIWGEMMYSVRTGAPAVEVALGKPLWPYLDEHPQAATRFNNAMGDLARNVHLAAIEACDFSQVRSVVDVGGGTGALLAHVLTAYPHITGILFDLPRVVARAEPLLAAAGVLQRCELVGGDLFDCGLPSGRDLYLMSLVLHDFDDDDAVKILSRVREATPGNGALVILEQVVPPDGRPHMSKLVDLNMLVISGGRERTKREFAFLLDAAGFRCEQVLCSTTPISAVIATPVERRSR